MLDTLRAEADGLRISPAILEFLQDEYPTATYHRGQYAPTMVWEGASWQDERLGTMGIKSNRTGNYLWAERSLGKFANGDNCKQLGKKESIEIADQWLSEIEQKYKEFLEPGARGLREMWKCKRADFYYQRKVDNSAAVCSSLAQAFSDKSRLASYLTSLEVMQSREFRGRFYDKGYESRNEAYLNTLRHEEQVRGYNRAGYLVDLGSMNVNVEAVRCHMNKRFEGWPESGLEVPDIGSLIEEHKVSGMAAASLVLLPSLELLAKETLSKETFYKYRRLANEFRRRKVSVDLRVPVDAWED